jgi:acetyl-CoA decarbonylase/synthase complex subunit gamma
VSHKKLIIPGYAAAISGDLEEEVKESEVLVGPREASQIAKFLKEFAV